MNFCWTGLNFVIFFYFCLYRSYSIINRDASGFLNIFRRSSRGNEAITFIPHSALGTLHWNEALASFCTLHSALCIEMAPCLCVSVVHFFWFPPRPPLRIWCVCLHGWSIARGVVPPPLGSRLRLTPAFVW